MKNHNFAAGAFLVIVIGGGGTLIGRAVMNQIAERNAQATEQERNDVREILKRAVERGQRGRYRETIQILEDAVPRYSHYSAIWLNLGIAQRAEGKLVDAARSFDRALQANPEDWDALAEMATVRKLQGRETDALGNLERIPSGRGRVRERLEADPAWAAADDAGRLAALRQKHGGVIARDTSVRRLQDLERPRRRLRTAASVDGTAGADSPNSPAGANSADPVQSPPHVPKLP